MQNLQFNSSYCIIGAGPSGLAASRALSRLGITHTIYEKHSDLGGIWDMNNMGTSMYQSAHFISSKWTSGFIGFPMPKAYADYPHHKVILKYLHSFADAFDLRRHIEFNAEVESAERTSDSWLVKLKDGRIATHRGIICADGVTWSPSLPTWPGRFEGEIRHSNTYRDSSEFKDKRVLIIGLGNSGADIACDAARNASKAYVSVRRGYHFLPKHVYGWPIDVHLKRPDLLPQAIKDLDLKAGIFAVIGETSRWGMPKPDHQIGQTHPLLNTQLIHHLGHGDITICPDIERLDGDRVIFKDGKSLKIDLILAATGYRVEAPYLNRDFFEMKGQRPVQYLNVFNRNEHELFTIGFAEVAAGIYPLIDQMAHMVAHHIDDRLNNRESARKFEDLKAHDSFDTRGGKQYVSSDRHANYIDFPSYSTYVGELSEKFGWSKLSEDTYKASYIKSSK